MSFCVHFHRITMQRLLLVVLMALSAEAGFPFNATNLHSTGSKNSAAAELLSSSTKSCPLGWIYEGKLGCIYFNTDKDKVLT